MRRFRSHGDGRFERGQLGAVGDDVVIEDGVRVWHPENVEIGDNVYLGHDVMLKGYYQNKLIIGSDTWIGQGAFLHSAGGLSIGRRVGIAPYVKMITSYHMEEGRGRAILDAPLVLEPSTIEDDANLGLGSIIVPGVRVCRGAQVAAGAVVTKDVEPYAVVAGNPARVLRYRPE